MGKSLLGLTTWRGLLLPLFSIGSSPFVVVRAAIDTCRRAESDCLRSSLTGVGSRQPAAGCLNRPRLGSGRYSSDVSLPAFKALVSRHSTKRLSAASLHCFISSLPTGDFVASILSHYKPDIGSLDYFHAGCSLVHAMEKPHHRPVSGLDHRHIPYDERWEHLKTIIVEAYLGKNGSGRPLTIPKIADFMKENHEFSAE